MPEISRAGLLAVNNWVLRQRNLVASNPRHRVIIDVDMESVWAPSQMTICQTALGSDHLRFTSSLAAMRGIPTERLWDAIQSFRNMPPQGAGGLGIISEAINWTAARYGLSNGYGLFNISLLHTQRRTQQFEGNRQKIRFTEAYPEGVAGYHYLGSPVNVKLYGEDRPVDVWMFDGFAVEDYWTPALRLSVPGITGILYHSGDSQENLDQMHVLGQGGFRIAQHFGLIGTMDENGKPDNLTSLVIGHDGHTALFKFSLFDWFYEHNGRDMEAALEATRMLCAATIHAPQGGTVPRTTGDMVKKHYAEDDECMWGLFGVEPENRTNAMFAEIQLSGRTGVVSPLHFMVTAAERDARDRGFSSTAPKLIPDNVSPRSLRLFPDTIDVDGWLGLGTQLVLDSYDFTSGWRQTPGLLANPEVENQAIGSIGFRTDMAQAFAVQDKLFMDLIRGSFPRKFGAEIPENAIVFASLRRATAYKIGLLLKFLQKDSREIISSIAAELDRPVFYLFGGVAHHSDILSIGNLESLLSLIQDINTEQGTFGSDFLVDYDYSKAKWIFQGLALRGCWVGATNPISNRSQGTEAFGPSYIKASSNGVYILGTDDGGAGCLKRLPTVSIYGPTTNAAGNSLHNHLWSNSALRDNAETILANSFIGGFAQMARRIDAFMTGMEQGNPAFAPGLEDKIRAMFHVISRYNGTVLMDAYLDGIR